MHLYVQKFKKDEISFYVLKRKHPQITHISLNPQGEKTKWVLFSLLLKFKPIPILKKTWDSLMCYHLNSNWYTLSRKRMSFITLIQNEHTLAERKGS